MTPAEAIEAAAEAIFISTGQGGVQWEDLDTYVKDSFRKDGVAALEAAAPHMCREAKAEAWDEGLRVGAPGTAHYYLNPYRPTL